MDEKKTFKLPNGVILNIGSSLSDAHQKKLDYYDRIGYIDETIDDSFSFVRSKLAVEKKAQLMKEKV